MQSRKFFLGVAVLLGSSTLAVAQAPTPTPVDSNIAVSTYAQSRGQSSLRHCTVDGLLCNTANCAQTGKCADNTTHCNTDADCTVGGTPCTGGQICSLPAPPVPCITQAGEGCGGCYPVGLPTGNALVDLLAQLVEVNPEWQPVGPMISGGPDTSLPPLSNAVTVHGTVALTQINVGGDFPGSHIGDDQNTFVQLDGADNGITSTGEYNSPNCPGDNCGVIEMELEFNKYPLFAWAGEGDRITAEGRWIFDCGHPDPAPLGKCSNNASRPCILDADCQSGGTCTAPAANFNYRSELHPPKAIAVVRNKNTGKKPATQADIYITADGGGAGDTCTVTHLTNAGNVLSQKTCLLSHCSKTTNRSCATNKDCAGGETCITYDPSLGGPLAVINGPGSDFEFDMAMPPTPINVPNPTLKTSFKPFKTALGVNPPSGQVMPPKPTVTMPTPGIAHVLIPMSSPVGKKTPNVFAGRLIASWKEDVNSLTHVQVNFQSLTINNPLKRGTPAIPQVCTNSSGVGLSSTPCPNGNSDCAPGTCTKNDGTVQTKQCFADSECPKTQFCQFPSVCVGGIPPGWELFGEVNGDWLRFTDKQPNKSSLIATIGKDTVFITPPYSNATQLQIPLKNLKFDEYVEPTAGTIHIASTGHSVGCNDVNLYGHNLKDTLNKFGLVTGAGCFGESDPDPGRIEVTHSGPISKLTDFSLGQLTGAECDPPVKGVSQCTATPTSGDGGTCSITTSRLCVDNKDCPAGTCSLKPSQTCHVDADCTTFGTCTGAPEVCDGKCSAESTNAGAACTKDSDCTGSDPGVACQFGPAWTLTYTFKVF